MTNVLRADSARGAELIVLASHEALGGFDCHGGVAAIGVGANRLGELLTQVTPPSVFT
jgi:hypothetical protein